MCKVYAKTSPTWLAGVELEWKCMKRHMVGFLATALPFCCACSCHTPVRTVDGGDYEDVRIHRLFAKLGVMFAEQRNSSTGGVISTGVSACCHKVPR